MKKIWIGALILVLMLLSLSSCSKKHSVKFYNGDELVESYECKKGTILELPKVDKEGYKFIGWNCDDELYTGTLKVSKDYIFKAEFEVEKFSYKFLVDGKVIKSGELEYNSELIQPNNVTKDSDNEYNYIFKGWDKEITRITEDVEYNAVFEKVDRQYTYKYIVDGNVIKENTCSYNGTPEEVVNPTKASTAEFEYTFKGWKNYTDTITKDVEFIAEFIETRRQYTYKFISNGTVIKEEKVDYGTEIEYPENPTKPATAKYTYTFSKWDKSNTIVTGNITFNAMFSSKINQYKVTFINYDDTLIYEAELDYDSMPEAPDDYKIPVEDGYKFVFAGWSPSIEKVSGTKTYKAVFTKKDANITSLEGLKIGFLGDSITTFYAEGSAMNSYYGGENQFYYPRYSSTIKTVEKTWWAQLINNNKMVLGINNSWSGSQACGTGNQAGQSDARINTLVENGIPDIVIVYLGTNDCGSSRTVSEYAAAMNNIYNKIKKLGVEQIFYVTLGYSDYSGGTYTDAKRIQFNDEIKKIVSSTGCGIIPLDEYVIDDNYDIYLGDKLHYNAKGATLLSLIAEKAIKEYNNISFDKTINVEHNEKLPENVSGKITVTKFGGFWTGTAYEDNVFLLDEASSEYTSPLYSFRIEIKKNSDGKYYVSQIIKSGESFTKSGGYLLVISDSNKEATALKKAVSEVKVGNLVEFDEKMGLPLDLIFYK